MKNNLTNAKNIEELVEISLQTNPDDIDGALIEYFENNSQLKGLDKFKKKIQEDKEYEKMAKKSIAYTSFLLNILNTKVLGSYFDKFNTDLFGKDFSVYLREFFFLSKNDDINIYEMKMYYFKNLNAENLELEETVRVLIEDEEISLPKNKTIKDIVKEYDEKLESIQKQYAENKSFLLNS